MEKYIHDYLTENYYPYKNKQGEYWLYLNDDLFGEHTNANGYDLLCELRDIYGLEVVETKLYIFTWAIQIYKDIDLSAYWDHYEAIYVQKEEAKKKWSALGYLEGYAYPVVQRIVAHTLASDLVSVQPMEAPKGMIFYMDYMYDGVLPKDRPKPTIYQKFKARFDKIIIFIKEIPNEVEKYLHISNYYNTFVIDKE